MHPSFYFPQSLRTCLPSDSEGYPATGGRKDWAEMQILSKVLGILRKRPEMSFSDDIFTNINLDAEWIYHQRPRCPSKNFEGDLLFHTVAGKFGTVLEAVRSFDSFYLVILWDGDESPTDYDEGDEELTLIVPMSNP